METHPNSTSVPQFESVDLDEEFERGKTSPQHRECSEDDDDFVVVDRTGSPLFLSLFLGSSLINGMKILLSFLQLTNRNWLRSLWTNS